MKNPSSDRRLLPAKSSAIRRGSRLQDGAGGRIPDDDDIAAMMAVTSDEMPRDRTIAISCRVSKMVAEVEPRFPVREIVGYIA